MERTFLFWAAIIPLMLAGQDPVKAATPFGDDVARTAVGVGLDEIKGVFQR